MQSQSDGYNQSTISGRDGYTACGQLMPIPRSFESTNSYTTDQPCEVCVADINQYYCDACVSSK